MIDKENSVVLHSLRSVTFPPWCMQFASRFEPRGLGEGMWLISGLAPGTGPRIAVVSGAYALTVHQSVGVHQVCTAGFLKPRHELLAFPSQDGHCRGEAFGGAAVLLGPLLGLLQG